MIGTLFFLLPSPKITAATAHFQMVLYSVNTWEKKTQICSQSTILSYLSFFPLEGLFIH